MFWSQKGATISIKGIQGSGFFVSEIWIPDSNVLWDSEFHVQYSGIQSLGF